MELNRQTEVYFLCKAGTAGTEALIQDFMERLIESNWLIMSHISADIRTYILDTKQLVFTQLSDPETESIKASYVNSKGKSLLAFAAAEEQVTTRGGLLTQLISVTVTALKQIGTTNAITIVSSDNGVTFQAQCDADAHAVLSDYAMPMPEAQGHFNFSTLVEAIRNTEQANDE